MTFARKDNKFDCLAKLLVIGDSGVGKTNILLRFSENHFHNQHLTTIGIDFKIKTIEVEGKRVKLQIWDTAGQERFKTITQTYYKGAHGIILVYSITERDTFHNIQNWLSQIKLHATENVCKILVGNKLDLESQRQVGKKEGQDLADSLGIQFFETTAKEKLNIDEMFQSIGKMVKDVSMAEAITPIGTQLSNNIKTDTEKKDSRCC